MPNELDVFHFDSDRDNFEGLGISNGGRYWFATDIMRLLGYETYPSFKAVINRAIAACVALDIEVSENFIQLDREVDGKHFKDHKLSRFACYLIAMNGDSKKPQVARAQVYFIAIAETFRYYLDECENVERVLIREEISDRESSLSGVAKQHGVVCYPLFQNAGYRGMYNRNLAEIKRLKGLNGKTINRSLLDFMGKEELAANLFRITQTESKIRNEDASGQARLERIAEAVGKEVRDTMIRISGTRPEDLPTAEDVKFVKKQIKQTHKKLQEIDRPKGKKDEV